MKNINNISVTGVLEFDPPNTTKKHLDQSTWKKVAIIQMDGDVDDYYRWFMMKQYGLKLCTPIRGPHITIINDSVNDLSINLPIDKIEDAWDIVKNRWNGNKLTTSLDVDIRSDGKHWWLKVPTNDRNEIHAIRQELGLDRPFFGLHMTIGYANDRDLPRSKFILDNMIKLQIK